MNENKSCYLIMIEDGYYISDDPNLDRAKVIWRHKIDRVLNTLVLSYTENGVNGNWIILAMSPLHDSAYTTRLLMWKYEYMLNGSLIDLLYL